MPTSRRSVLFNVSSPAVMTLAVLLVSLGSGGIAQESKLAPAPRTISPADASDLSRFDKQLVKLPAAKVIHSDTAQLFMFGDKAHPVHVIIPSPATDAAHEGDTVELTGIVRHYDVKEFERGYRWFRASDYPDVHGGDWVIVATSVRTPEGTELVPPSTISTLPPDAPKTKPEVKP